jgi:hypothetical protein
MLFDTLFCYIRQTANNSAHRPFISQTVIATPGQSRAKYCKGHPKTEQNVPAQIIHTK